MASFLKTSFQCGEFAIATPISMPPPGMVSLIGGGVLPRLKFTTYCCASRPLIRSDSMAHTIEGRHHTPVARIL